MTAMADSDTGVQGSTARAGLGMGHGHFVPREHLQAFSQCSRASSCISAIPSHLAVYESPWRLSLHNSAPALRAGSLCVVASQRSLPRDGQAGLERLNREKPRRPP